VALRLDRSRLPLRRQQVILTHQPQHAAHRGAHLAHPRPSPHLAVAFAMEGRLLDRAPDLGQGGFIAVSRLWAAPGRRPRAEGPPSPLVERRPRQAPRLQHPRGARTSDLWRPSGRGSSPRPPPQKRLLVLHAPDALAQQLVLHGHLGDDFLLPPALLVELGFLPGFERLRATSKEGVAPLAEGGGGDAILAARGLQIGATERLQNDARFAFGRPAALAAAAGFRIARRSPSGSLKWAGRRMIRGGYVSSRTLS